jgi:hypothetical protein
VAVVYAMLSATGAWKGTGVLECARLAVGFEPASMRRFAMHVRHGVGFGRFVCPQHRSILPAKELSDRLTMWSPIGPEESESLMEEAEVMAKGEETK